MKKLSLVLAFLILTLIVSAQGYPITQNLGSSNSLVRVPANGAMQASLINRTFSDTTAANLTNIKYYPGAMIYATTGDGLWIRNAAATAWVQVSSSGGSVNIYNSNGTLTGNRILSGGGLYELGLTGLTSLTGATTAGTSFENTNGSSFTSIQAAINAAIIKANRSAGMSDILVYWDTLQIRPHLGNLRIDTLQAGGSSDALMTHNSTTGVVGRVTTLPSGLVPTWQQTLTAGSSLTQANTIDGNNFNFTLDSVGILNIHGRGGLWSDSAKGNFTLQSATASARIRTLSVVSNTTAEHGAYGNVNDRSNPFAETFARNGSGSACTTFWYGDSIVVILSASTSKYIIQGLPNLPTQDRLLGQYTAENRVGYVTLGSGLSLSSGVLNTSGTVATPISSLTASAATNTITVGHSQVWNYNGITTGIGHQFSSNSITSGTILDITGTSTALAANNEGLNIAIGGANGTNAITATGARISVTNTNATSGTNVGLEVTASGATTGNYSIIVPSGGGNVGIGTSAPTSLAHINGVLQMGTASSTLGQILMSGNTSGTVTIKPAAAAGTWSLTLPTNDGDADQFLQTDGSGVGSWATAATASNTLTLTNKRWTARVGSTTSSATPTINTDNVDIYKITALSTAITSMSSSLSGTPVDGDILEIQITDDGTARGITWGASFVSTTVTLPATTVISTTLTIILQYYTTSSYGNNKWACVNYY